MTLEKKSIAIIDETLSVGVALFGSAEEISQLTKNLVLWK